MKSIAHPPAVSAARAEGLLTSHEVARLLQVNPTSVNNWIREGRLPAFRTPGGHRRIRTSDLLVFMRSHQMPIPSALRPSLARRVMVVDDEPALVVSTRRILQRVAPGIEVETFDSAISALLSVTTFRPDLIIFDIFMPALDGLQACRRLKARPDTAGIQLVITSGALTDDLRREAFEIGVHACLSKPFGPEELIAAIGTELTPIED